MITNFFHLSFLLLFSDPGSEIRDPGWVKIRDPGSRIRNTAIRICLITLMRIR